MSTEDGGFPTIEPGGGNSPRLGFGAKLWNLFVDPRKTFSSVGRGHEWIILLILASVIAIGSYMPIKEYVRQDQISKIEEYLDKRPQVPPEQRAEILQSVSDRFDNPMNLLWVPVGYIIRLFVVAGILLFLGNIIHGGSIKFLRILNAYGWTLMIAIPASIVTIPMVMAKGSMDVSLGLGVLTSPETGEFLKSFLTSFEVFTLWQVWLSAVAIAVLAPTETGKAFWSVFVAWLVWVCIQSGLAAIGIPIQM